MTSRDWNSTRKVKKSKTQTETTKKNVQATEHQGGDLTGGMFIGHGGI